MKGCLPCKCGSDRLIPHIYVGEPTLVLIHCIDCDMDGDKAETFDEAIRLWNRKMTGR